MSGDAAASDDKNAANAVVKAVGPDALLSSSDSSKSASSSDSSEDSSKSDSGSEGDSSSDSSQGGE